ncbi:MAG: hypothetical protein JRI23_14490 [Deltaproteobacteria bacterium]|jgi:hypothetical protein|nr:hypothetical protein [Deltaproteobacteria bacterium]MBW2532954.1 hypothetical protein [Deltaproteobacteria bacterium]
MSILQTKARAIAAGAVVATSAAAPVAVWYVNEVLPAPVLVKHGGVLPRVMDLPEPPAPEPASTQAVVLDEVVIVEPRRRPARRAAKAVKPAADRRCVWHQSVALSSGKVRVCDVERTTTGQGERLLAPMKKRQRLGQALDLRSPTGLLEAAQRRARTRRTVAGRAPDPVVGASDEP